MTLSIDDVVAGYRLEDRLGEGAYGVVWRARGRDGKAVAIKLLKERHSRDIRRRFELETTALQLLQHPRCVRYIDAGEHAGTPFLVTEYVLGDRLDVWIERRHDPRTQRLVCRQIAEGLAAAHARGILHRDLKPMNIIVGGSEESPKVTLLDFGISRLAGTHPTDITKTGELNGTPGYMSPEQLRAQHIGRATDVYALGVIFFEIFQRRHPFDAPSAMQLCMAHLTDPPPVATRAPEDLTVLISRMLAKRAAERPALTEVLTALGSKAHRRRNPRPVTKSQGLPAWLAAGAVIALVGIGALTLRDTSEPARPSPQRSNSVALLTSAEPVDAGREAKGDASSPTDLSAAPDVSGPCVRELSPGHHLLIDDPDFPVWAYVPTTVAKGSTPVVWALHDFGITSEQVIRHPALVAQAERHGHILVAPSDDSFGKVWSASEDIKHLLSLTEIIDPVVCADPQRRYGLGLGAGGAALHRLGCSKVFAANAVVGARTSTNDTFCEGLGIPLIAFSGTADGAAPVAGGTPCWSIHIKGLLEGNRVISLERQEDEWRARNRCTGTPRPVETKHPELSCETMDCQSELVWCHDPGGRYLPGLMPDPAESPPIAAGIVRDCGRPLEVDPTALAWDFFVKHEREVAN